MFCSPSSRIWFILKEGEKGPSAHFLASVAILRTWLVMSPSGRSAKSARAAMEPAEAPDTCNFRVVSGESAVVTASVGSV